MTRPGAVDPLDRLVDRVRAGDREAIAEVYLEVAPALRSFLRRQVPHGEVADDLVEGAFLALIDAHDRIRGDGASLRAWLYRAARNDLIDWRKRAERRSDHELTEARRLRLVDPDPTPDEQVLADEVAPDLLAALAALTPEQREVVELRIVAGLPLAQVAEITGRTVGAVKALQHRAIAGLIRRLDP